MEAAPIDPTPPLSPNASIGGAILSHVVKEVANISAGAAVLESLCAQGRGLCLGRSLLGDRLRQSPTEQSLNDLSPGIAQWRRQLNFGEEYLCNSIVVGNAKDVATPPVSPGYWMLSSSTLDLPTVHLHVHVHSASREESMEGGEGDGGDDQTQIEFITSHNSRRCGNSAYTGLFSDIV
jgi:hypothetical protein